MGEMRSEEKRPAWEAIIACAVRTRGYERLVQVRLRRLRARNLLSNNKCGRLHRHSRSARRVRRTSKGGCHAPERVGLNVERTIAGCSQLSTEPFLRDGSWAQGLGFSPVAEQPRARIFGHIFRCRYRASHRTSRAWTS